MIHETSSPKKSPLTIFSDTSDDRPDPAAFLEWQQDLPTLTDDDRSRLDKAQAHYAHLSKHPILEAMVKMVILSPLLELAGFYDAPFYATSEKSVNISTRDNNLTVRGKIDGNLYQVLAILKHLANLLK